MRGVMILTFVFREFIPRIHDICEIEDQDIDMM